MPDTWDPEHPELVNSFPVVLDGRDGAVDVWRDGQWSYYALFAGAAQGPWNHSLPLELATANYHAGQWIAQQVMDCPHQRTETHVRAVDTGSGDWEVVDCLDCEQTISAGHI